MILLKLDGELIGFSLLAINMYKTLTASGLHLFANDPARQFVKIVNVLDFHTAVMMWQTLERANSLEYGATVVDMFDEVNVDDGLIRLLKDQRGQNNPMVPVEFAELKLALSKVRELVNKDKQRTRFAKDPHE